ncbi:MAG: hypothetical protein IPM38_18740 [Ignavibacteria bacterium]|nr:hypothetical protein [Ignavibacteria bacterium]
MKIFFLFIPFLLLISSCSGKDKEQNKISEAAKSNKISGDKNAGNKNSGLISGEKSLSDNPVVSDIQFGINLVPESLHNENKIIEAVKWKDSLGMNLIVITLSDEKTVYEDNRIKEFFVHHYLLSGNTKVLWKTYDFVKDCPFDITLEYIDRSLTVTDLDSNGLAETSFVYRLSCKSDVSPDDMKLIMHEGHKKYAVRGVMILKINNEDAVGGEMNIDASFSKAPPEFKIYAVEKWNKFNKDFVGEMYDK